jgi:hypothetical protein
MPLSRSTSSKHIPITCMNEIRHIYIHWAGWLNSQKTPDGSERSMRGSRTCRDNAVSTVPPRTSKLKYTGSEIIFLIILHRKLLYELKHWKVCLTFAKRNNKTNKLTLKTINPQVHTTKFWGSNFSYKCKNTWKIIHTK